MTIVKALAIAVAIVALLVLAVPIADWAYVKLASVDRHPYGRAIRLPSGLNLRPLHPG